MRTNRPRKRPLQWPNEHTLWGTIWADLRLPVREFDRNLDLELEVLRQDMRTIYRLRCHVHPRYSGQLPPRVKCVWCKALYESLQS